MKEYGYIIIGALASFFSGWAIFNFQRKKDKKNKLFELHGMLIENLTLLNFINQFCQNSIILYCFHQRSFEIHNSNLMDLTTNRTPLSSKQVFIDSDKREIQYSRENMDFHNRELSNWREKLIQEKGKLQKLFFQINSYKNVMDLESELNQIMNFELKQEYFFDSNNTIEEMYKINLLDIQNKTGEEIEKKFTPVSKKLYIEIYNRIK